MKFNATIIIILLLVSHVTICQKSSGEILFNKNIYKERVDTYRSGLSQVKDTLFPPIFFEECANEVFSFLNPVDWGFIGGTNSFADLEKAQKFSVENAEMIRIDQVGVFFAEAQIVSDGNVYVKIYDVDEATGGPGLLIGTSNTVKASEINIAQDNLLTTTFTFDNPPVVDGMAFFVSVNISELYTSLDTVSIFMSNIDCGNNNESWELFSDNATWASLADPDLSWNISSNFLMTAIVEYSETTSVVESSNPLGINVYPLPGSDRINIKYNLPESMTIRIDIYNMIGEKVYSSFKGDQPEGTHIQTTDISHLNNGTYFARISTQKSNSTTKIVVNH